MIARALNDYPGINVERLCASLGVSRSWFYEAGAHPSDHEQDMDLRDRIEHIVLQNTGYGYRRAVPPPHTVGGGPYGDVAAAGIPSGNTNLPGSGIL